MDLPLSSDWAKRRETFTLILPSITPLTQDRRIALFPTAFLIEFWRQNNSLADPCRGWTSQRETVRRVDPDFICHISKVTPLTTSIFKRATQPFWKYKTHFAKQQSFGTVWPQSDSVFILTLSKPLPRHLVDKQWFSDTLLFHVW